MTIGKYSETDKLLKKYDLRAKKKFGQNFLIDSNILNKIVKVAEIDANSKVIEIGPGLGALTEKLCENSGQVYAYEIDSDMVEVLKESLEKYDNVKIINEDFLKIDLSKYQDDEITVVANLPYYITTPILFKILESNIKIKKMVLMMQKEVAERITGIVGTKDYNALSILLSYKTNASIAFNVSKEVFLPKPSVGSAVVVLDVLKKPRVQVKDEEWFVKIVKSSFCQRRKTLVNNLKEQLGFERDEIEKLIIELNKDIRSRAEILTIEDFAYLSEKLKKNKI